MKLAAFQTRKRDCDTAYQGPSRRFNFLNKSPIVAAQQCLLAAAPQCQEYSGEQVHSIIILYGDLITISQTICSKKTSIV